MRGADGLSNAVSYSAALDGEVIYLPFYGSATFDTGRLKLRETSNYPYEGMIRLEILETQDTKNILALYLPVPVSAYTVEGAQILYEKDGFVFISGDWQPGSVIIVSFALSLRISAARSPLFTQKNLLTYGALLLSTPVYNDMSALPELADISKVNLEQAEFSSPNGKLYSPLGYMTFKSREEHLNTKLQIIF